MIICAVAVIKCWFLIAVNMISCYYGPFSCYQNELLYLLSMCSNSLSLLLLCMSISICSIQQYKQRRVFKYMCTSLIPSQLKKNLYANNFSLLKNADGIKNTILWCIIFVPWKYRGVPNYNARLSFLISYGEKLCVNIEPKKIYISL